MANKGKMLHRDFLKSLSMLPLTFSHSQGKPFFTPWLWKHPRRRSINPFFKNGKTILVVVEGRDVKKMLAAGIRAWPGFTEALEDKKRIVIKPNVTAPQIYPITTDLKLLQELILKIKQLSSAKLTVCDSSSYAGLTASRIFSKLGYFDLGKTEKINVLSIDPTVDSYCADLMEKYDETFAKERRVEAQLNYAQTLNLGTKDLAQAEIIEVTE